MKINRVIIVTLNRTPEEIDKMIGVIHAWGRTPIVVLGGTGDLFLKHSTQIENCDLAFDPNQMGEFSQIKAGLAGCQGHTLIFARDVREIQLSELKEIETHFYRAERDESIIRQNAAVLQMRYGWPDIRDAFVIQRSALSQVQDLPVECAWPFDSRLCVSAISCTSALPTNPEFVAS